MAFSSGLPEPARAVRSRFFYETGAVLLSGSVRVEAEIDPEPEMSKMGGLRQPCFSLSDKISFRLTSSGVTPVR